MLLTILLTSKSDIVNNQALENYKKRNIKLFLINYTHQKKTKKNTKY